MTRVMSMCLCLTENVFKQFLSFIFLIRCESCNTWIHLECDDKITSGHVLVAAAKGLQHLIVGPCCRETTTPISTDSITEEEIPEWVQHVVCLFLRTKTLLHKNFKLFKSRKVFFFLEKYLLE